jgi:hypothetical protein
VEGNAFKKVVTISEGEVRERIAADEALFLDVKMRKTVVLVALLLTGTGASA